jgi:hypothetical protein
MEILKKRISLLALFVICAGGLMQAQAFRKGDAAINFGFGVGYTYDNGAGLPGILLSGEKGISDIEDVGVLSIGGIAGFKHASSNNYGPDWSWNDFFIGGRGILHMDLFNDNTIDTYGGMSLGLRFYNNPEFHENQRSVLTNTVGPLFGLFFGGRYFFTPKAAVFGEMGYDITWLKFGLTVKI